MLINSFPLKNGHLRQLLSKMFPDSCSKFEELLFVSDFASRYFVKDATKCSVSFSFNIVKKSRKRPTSQVFLYFFSEFTNQEVRKLHAQSYLCPIFGQPFIEY